MRGCVEFQFNGRSSEVFCGKEVRFFCGRKRKRCVPQGRAHLVFGYQLALPEIRYAPDIQSGRCPHGGTSADYVNKPACRKQALLGSARGYSDTLPRLRERAAEPAFGRALSPPFKGLITLKTTPRVQGVRNLKPNNNFAEPPLFGRSPPMCRQCDAPKGGGQVFKQKSRGRSVRGSSVGSLMPGSGIRAESQWVGPWCGSRVLAKRAGGASGFRRAP